MSMVSASSHGTAEGPAAVGVFPAEGSLYFQTINMGASSSLGETVPHEAMDTGAGPLSSASDLGLVAVRCQASLQLSAYTGTDAPNVQKAMDLGVARLEEQLSQQRIVFLVKSSIDEQQVVAGSGSSGALQQLSGSFERPLQASPLLQAPPSSGPAPPTYEYQALPEASTSSPSALTLHSSALDLDVMCYVPGSTLLSELGPRALAPALISQLRGFRRVLREQQKLVQVKVYHFLPPGRVHHVTALYPELAPGAGEEINELKRIPIRKELHKLLGLPDNRPALRVPMALTFSPPPSASSGGPTQLRLRDVHVGLPVPGIGGTVYTIQGSYDYYHYMQDRFNDNGWGCAYRSLQTICSWFQIQQYTTKSPPGHREIQETLVRLGDKAQGFVGSSNWIGAIELSYLLDDYLGVTSKILTINKGSDIPSHARELIAHFQTQGTPVMIGGGVLAYTLLGIQFNELTGECAFLILDPHYTGGEDLKKIHQGTWVAWKRPGDNAAAGGPLFVNSAFYNFLCPQRPNSV